MTYLAATVECYVPLTRLSPSLPNPAAPEKAARWIDPLTEADWDASLAGNPSATFFHGRAWAQVLHRTYGFTPTYLILRAPASDHSASLLPIMEVASWLTGKRGIGLPFTDECAPIAANQDQIRSLFSEATQHGLDRGWKYLELRGGIDIWPDATPSTSFWGHRLELASGESTLFSRVNGSVRRAVRKAEQAGLSLDFSQSLDAMRIFYRLLCKTRQRHGVPPQPWRFFSNIHQHVLAADLGWVVLARLGSVPVAGAVFFRSGKTALYKFGASDDTQQHLRANNLVMWQAIKWFVQQSTTTSRP